MVVIVLIGIVSAMILPEMKGTFGDAMLRASARDLVNAFSIAGSRAVSLNQVQVVRITGATGRYELERQMQTQGRKPEFVPVKDVAESSGKLDSRITVEVHKTDEPESGNAESGENREPAPARDLDPAEVQSLPDAVMFYPDGTADAAEVLLRDRAGFGLKLRISPITARVEILELAREEAPEPDAHR